MDAERPMSVPGHDWNAEWEVAWKADAANPWFRYQADVYRTWLTDVAARRILKTDAFDEACGFRPLDALPAGASVVLMDVSPRILGEASRQRHLGCATDVRHLAFRSGTFEAVFSPSSLDHFDDPRDIDLALRELHRVLVPGGRLLITLDNPANPILCARHAVHRLLGRIGGLIPFRMGRTLSRARMITTLERAGFEVTSSGYAIHAPRILGLWLGEWAVRRRHPRAAAGLRRLLGRVERIGARLPVQALTGHFVVADCRRVER